MTRWLLLALLAALACALQDAQLPPSARPAAASLRDPESDDAAAVALEAAEAEAARLLHDAIFITNEYELENEDEDEDDENEVADSENDECEDCDAALEESEDSEAEGAEEGEEEELETAEVEELTADDARGVAERTDGSTESEKEVPAPRAAAARLTVRGVIFPDANRSADAPVTQVAEEERVEEAAHAHDARVDILSSQPDDPIQLDSGGESIVSKKEEATNPEETTSSESVAASDRATPADSFGIEATMIELSDEDMKTADQDDGIVGPPLSSSLDDSDVAVDDQPIATPAGEDHTAAVDVVDSTCAADSASGTNSCIDDPLLDDDAAQVESDEVVEASSSSEDTVDAAVTQNSSNAFQEIVQDLAVAAEQIVRALREGRLPHSPTALSEAVDSARGSIGASAKSAMEFAARAVDVCYEPLVLTQAKLVVLLDASLERLGTWGGSLARTLHTWSKQLRAMFREVSTWCWEVWSTYEELHVLVRNLRGLALLAFYGLLFFALYRLAAAIPELLFAYFLSFDDVTRAQLKIFSVVLALVVVYHARVLAWFWILALATLGYYYWSGHIVISVEFK